MTIEREYSVMRMMDSASKVQDWPEWSDINVSGVTDRYRSSALYLNGMGYTKDGDHFRWLLDDFAPLRDARITELGPGGFILTHTDNGPYFERWQVPIKVFGQFWCRRDGRDEYLIQDPGVPWRVHHHLPHGLDNTTTKPRQIILIDRDIPLDVPGVGREYRLHDEWCVNCGKQECIC